MKASPIVIQGYMLAVYIVLLCAILVAAFYYCCTKSKNKRKIHEMMDEAEIDDWKRCGMYTSQVIISDLISFKVFITVFTIINGSCHSFLMEKDLWLRAAHTNYKSFSSNHSGKWRELYFLSPLSQYHLTILCFGMDQMKVFLYIEVRDDPFNPPEHFFIKCRWDSPGSKSLLNISSLS